MPITDPTEIYNYSERLKNTVRIYDDK